MTNQVIPNEALEAVVTALEFHLTDKSQDSGCALRCGFDGDDMALHLAQHILEAAAPHMLRDAWESGRVAGNHSLVQPNPYEVSK